MAESPSTPVSSSAAVTSHEGERYRDSRTAYYTLGVLTIVYSINFIDRQLLSILQEPIKMELGLSDGQLGLLTGFAFALFYVTAGIPIARWADKANRRNIISWSVAIWSGMTALSGLVQNYWQLLAARIGVGIGEAGCSPPAHSMLSDIFPPERRATAMSIYSTGINIGILFGFLLGGWLNEFFGWRVAFMVVGLPGIAIALLLKFTVPEPIRGFSEPDHEKKADDVPVVPFKEVLALLWSRPSFRHLALGGALTAFCGYALISWIASFIIRTHGMQTGELGTWLAATSVAGAVGTLTAGIIADRMGQRDKRWYMWVPGIAALIVGPASAAAFLQENAYATLALYAIPTFFTTFYVGSCIATVHQLVGLQMRAVGSAIFFLVLNIIGLGLGPVSVGYLSDYWQDSMGVDSLRYSLVTILPIVATWSALHFMLAAKSLKADLARAPS